MAAVAAASTFLAKGLGDERGDKVVVVVRLGVLVAVVFIPLAHDFLDL